MPQFPIHGGPLKTECETTGEHQGDAYKSWDLFGAPVIVWHCCDEVESDPDE